MSTPALDRDRLLADLESAAAWAHVKPEGRWPVRWVKLRGYELACRVIAAAIVDGEYDVDPGAVRSMPVPRPGEEVGRGGQSSRGRLDR